MPPAEPTDYRLAPSFAARLFGLGLVVLAVGVVVFSVVAAAVGWPIDSVVVVVASGLALVVGAVAWLRTRAYVVRLDANGYHVRFVRGAGVRRGRWAEVEEAVAASPRNVACVVLRRRDGASTSIPVELLAVPSDRFADDVRERLAAAARDR